MNAKVSTIVALCIVVAICVLQALYSEQLGTLAARSIAKSARPVRRFYTWTSFGKPLGACRACTAVKRWSGTSSIDTAFTSRNVRCALTFSSYC